MTYYIGKTPEDVLGDQPRYFYGLRRTNDGEVYFGRVDQMNNQDSLTINSSGDPSESYNDFEIGVDFYNGRDIYHNLIFDNLQYEQFRWDDRSIYYYIDSEGQLVARINQGYTYPSGV